MPATALNRPRAWLALVALAGLLGVAGCLVHRGTLSPSATSTPAAADAKPAVMAPTNQNDARRTGQPTVRSRANAFGEDTPGIAGRLLQDGEPLAGASIEDDDSPPLVVNSAADGRFFLPLGAGRSRLEIRGATVPPGVTVGPIALAEGERFDVGDVEVPRPATVTGRVLDERGQPLAGIPVFAAPHGAYLYPFEILALEAAPSVATDDDGRFVLANLLPGTTRVFVDDPDRLAEDNPQDAVLELASGGNTDLGELVVQRAAALHGVIRDEQGQPIAGARVMPGDGLYDRTHPRRAVLCDADGRFVIRGFGAALSITVEAEGFAPQRHHDVDQAPRPLRVQMQRESPLLGIVAATGGKRGVLRLEPEGVRGRPSTHAIEPDGSFRIDGLGTGTWLVRAWVPGVGSSRFVPCALPQREPLRIELDPARNLTVRVVDDLDRPIRDAGVSLSSYEDSLDLDAWALHDDGRDAVTGEHGLATLSWSSPRSVLVVAKAAGHCSARIDVDRNTLPDTVILRLPRAGAVQGRVVDVPARLHAHVRVHLHRTDRPQEEASVCTLDSRGCFHSGSLPAGSYVASLSAGDAASVAWAPEHARPLPLLGRRAEVGDAVPVQVVAGACAMIEFAAPRVGTLHGRVLAAGSPVPGAVVFAEPGPGDGTDCGWPHEPQRLDNRFFAQTDADGRFCFLAPQAGTFRLRARHAHGAGWSAPLVVDLPTSGGSIACDIHLDAATIRGRVDLALLPPAERRGVRVHLCPLRDADKDPRTTVWTEDGSKWLQDLGAEMAPDRAGAFAFACLPAASWLCRVVGERGILLQQLVHTTPDAVVDLGSLQPGTGVTPRLLCGLGERSAVQWQQLDDGHELFLRHVDNSKGNGFDWGMLVPGRYRLRAMSMKEVRTWLGDRTWVHWKPDAPVGEPVEIEVHADGSCTPSAIWPDGK